MSVFFAQTAEAKFAHRVDKLEAGIQCKYYEENNCNDYVTPREGIFEKLRKDSIVRGFTTMAKAWIEYDKENSYYDELFKMISDFVADNKIFKD